MVCDFSDIKRIVKGWIDAELDHKMLLRHDDPLVAPLQQLGEPVFLLDSNPTVERIAKLIFDKAHEQGLPVVRVTVWETPTSFAEYRAREASSKPLEPRAALISSRSSSISTARWSIRGATSPTRPTRCSCRAARRRSPRSASAGWSATARPTLVARAFEASGVERAADALERYLAFYDERLLNHTRPYPGIPDGARGARRRAPRSRC